MFNLVFPLHKIVDTGVKYFGFATGNIFYIVKAETSTITTTYSYFQTTSKSAYDAGIAAPSGLTYSQTFPMGQEINFDFLFNL